MPRRIAVLCAALLCAACQAPAPAAQDSKAPALRIHWDENILTISGDHVPGKEMKTLYLEAYCRPGSTDRDWGETVIGHSTELVEASDDGKLIKLKCTLRDGVTVDHEIRAGTDEVDFRLTAHNPTDKTSLAHWAQPCMRVDGFTGGNQETYLNKCFVFLDGGKLTRLPTHDWATEARYTPGQVWCPKHVDRNDVNPRPLSKLVPDNGLVGCFSADETMILATAFEPYQELFQGVITCLHADFRLGGLEPGETKKIRGKVYIVPNDVDALLKRYAKDFPEHQKN
jgi:hypothetical protein